MAEREEVYHSEEKRATVPEFGRRAHRGNGHSAKIGTGLMSPENKQGVPERGDVPII